MATEKEQTTIGPKWHAIFESPRQAHPNASDAREQDRNFPNKMYNTHSENRNASSNPGICKCNISANDICGLLKAEYSSNVKGHHHQIGHKVNRIRFSVLHLEQCLNKLDESRKATDYRYTCEGEKVHRPMPVQSKCSEQLSLYIYHPGLQKRILQRLGTAPKQNKETRILDVSLQERNAQISPI
ncbi:hypothetical protein AVEN_34855-1 [Araneus ventricosus]|uniref:Uncharacterized protein n=1 Tax=Araneus ventricosus TaxID=182803 RepID=A0A4Y2LWV8_ARAVE|nr:hypothetical protein AVEN_34855-1 [Araneus ventricosus]